MKKPKWLKKYLILFIVAVIAIVIVSIILKYQVEGEKNIPFQVSKIMVISNAVGIQKEEEKEKWDLELTQNNDIYIDIVKNKNYVEEEIIDKIILDNFTIDKTPLKGEIAIYGPQSFENGVYYNKEEYQVKDELIFEGNEEKSDIKNLQISNQGGLILIRAVNTKLGTYTSEEEEIRHDGTLLEKAGIPNEELKFKLEFDLGIELKSEKKYKTHVELDMPIGDITKEGITNLQKDGLQELVFKRY